MSLIDVVASKPVLIGLHLGAAIIGIDAFIWILGEIIANVKHRFRMRLAAMIGVVSFFLSWLFGGYYYVLFYGDLVKPIIKSGLAPWAHLVFMETKEHIFLFILPLAVTVMILVFLSEEEFIRHHLRRLTMFLAGLIVFLGLAVGAMGYVVSAAARWG